MPATIYSDIDGFHVTNFRPNRDGKTYSAYFENIGKIQLGNIDGTNQEVMSISDLMKGADDAKGIRLEVFERSVRRWLKNIEINLIFDVKKTYTDQFKKTFDTHEIQTLYHSMFVSKNDIEFRMSSNMNIYLMENGKPTRIDLDHLHRDVLCVPIVQFIGIWIEEDLTFGIVAKVTDIMCFEGEEEAEEEEEEDGKKIFHGIGSVKNEELTKATYNAPLRPDSPVESMMCGGTVVAKSVANSLHPDDLKPVK